MKKKFTLIELITGFVLLSIVIVGAITFIQNMLSTVVAPDQLIEQSNSFRATCHKIREDHDNNFRDNLSGLQTKIGSEGATQNSADYGKYKVIENRYVTFTENQQVFTETSAVTSNFLKVKISSLGGSETATLILSGDN